MIKNIVVIGAGTMGNGIAHTFAHGSGSDNYNVFDHFSLFKFRIIFIDN